jgi:hypothetical protein
MENLRDRRRQRRLPMIHMPHRPDVQMRLVPLKLFLGHDESWSLSGVTREVGETVVETGR